MIRRLLRARRRRQLKVLSAAGYAIFRVDSNGEVPPIGVNGAAGAMLGQIDRMYRAEQVRRVEQARR